MAIVRSLHSKAKDRIRFVPSFKFDCCCCCCCCCLWNAAYNATSSLPLQAGCVRNISSASPIVVTIFGKALYICLLFNVIRAKPSSFPAGRDVQPHDVRLQLVRVPPPAPGAVPAPRLRLRPGRGQSGGGGGRRREQEERHQGGHRRRHQAQADEE